MVKKALQLSIVLIGIILRPSAYADTSVKTQILLGESLTLSLRSADTHADYQKLDLSPLKRWAYIDDRQQTNERIRLRITPYTDGTFQLPALRSGDLIIQAQTIDVLPNPDIKLIWHAPNNQAWQGEWATWHLQVIAKDTGLPLSLDSTQQQDIVFSPQPVSQHIDNEKHAHFVFAQALNQPGLLQAARPILSVQNRQGGRWLFYPPEKSIDVRPLPSYLPADLGIGRYQLVVERPFWLTRGELATQRLTLTGFNSNGLPNPRTWLQSEGAFEWLTPRRDTKQQLSEQGVEWIQTIQQPFRPQHSDWGWYPPIRLTSFNPHSGLLEDHTWPAQPYLALPGWLQIILYLLGLMLTLALGWVIFQGAKRLYFRLRLVYRLRQATNAQAVWQAYQAWGVDRGLGEQPTHQAWLNAYQRRFGRASKLHPLFNALDAARFGKPPSPEK